MLNKDAILIELKRGSIYVDNAEKTALKNYVPVTLGSTLKIYSVPALNVTDSSPYEEITIPEEGYILKPGELYIGRINEYTKTYGFVPLLEGTEGLAALGMDVHITAGFGDNGFEGTWTLEITCSLPTIVKPGMFAGYLSYYPLIGEGDTLYRGKYFRQFDPETSRLSREYTRKREK